MEERGFHSLWVAEHVVLFDDPRSPYPYAADGRFPISGETGILDPPSLRCSLCLLIGADPLEDEIDQRR